MMVRVLSIPLFKKQNVNSIERSVSTCCVALPNKLLVASSSTHCIEVNNVNIEDVCDFDEDNTAFIQSPTFSFPTVDSVKQIIHCVNGNYIATIEAKSNTRQNRTTSYVRVYANWDSVATLQQSKMNRSGVSLGQSECGMVQPMRARIAGRVTPSVTQSGDVSSLEMIEIPVKMTPNLIACCQVSGNLLIASERRLTVYKCVIKVHETSKQTFLDFDAIPQYFELNFIPTIISLTENYISAFNPTLNNDTCIDYNKLCDNDSFVIKLPMITRENVLMYKNLPFMNSTNISVIIKSSSPIETTTQTYEIMNILQLKIRSDINVEGVIHQVSEEFHCYAVKPIYIGENNLLSTHNRSKGDNDKKTQPDKSTFLESKYCKNLKTLVFLVATSQEGYLFHIDTSENNGTKTHTFDFENNSLVGVYSFTTPVVDIALQDTILHALTFSGLESYTLKPPDRVHSQSDPIYLIDLKSFLGVKQILKTEKNLILLANYDGSPVRSSNSSGSSSSSNWTLYNLEMPSVIDLNKDILKIAEFHRKDSIQTYLHLLNKSYILLHLSLIAIKFEIKWENGIGIAAPINDSYTDIFHEFKTTCMLLGDFYLMSQNHEENKLPVFYYTLANLKPTDILRRFMDLERTSNDSKELQGLLYYLKSILMDVKFGQEADDMFTPIPDSSQYVQGIINYYKVNSNSNSAIDSDSIDNTSIPQFSSDNSPFCSSKNLLSDQEINGPPSLFLPESIQSDLCDMDNVNNDKQGSQSPSVELYNLSLSDSNFGQTFADLILDVFNVFHPTDIANFVIKNVVIREYATNKIINILTQRNHRNDTDNFALTLLYLQKNEIENASQALEQCSDETLMYILLKNTNLLFDSTLAGKTRKNIGFSELTTLLISNKSEFLSELFYKILTSTNKSITLREIIRIFVEYLPSHVGESSSNAINVFHLTLEKYLAYYFNQYTEFSWSIINDVIKESLKLLCRCYISKLLTATNLCQAVQGKPMQVNALLNDSTAQMENVYLYETNLSEDFLFKMFRFKYLDKIPVFDIFCPAENVVELSKKQFIYKILIKLEAILCSNVLPTSIINEIDLFLQNHPHFVGKIRLQSIILPLTEATKILIDRYPICLKLFGQDKYFEESHWQQLIASLEKEILMLKTKGVRGQQKLKLLQMTRRDILLYLATNYTFDRFLKVLPLEDSTKEDYLNELENKHTKKGDSLKSYQDCDNLDDNLSDFDSQSDEEIIKEDCRFINKDKRILKKKYSRYIELCKNSGHANQIQQFIIATGQQLLTTLNL